MRILPLNRISPFGKSSPLGRVPRLSKSLHVLRNILSGKTEGKHLFFSVHRHSHSDVDKPTCTGQVKLKENEDVLKFLQNRDLSVDINKMGSFVLVKENKHLLYDRIVYKPKSYDKLREFINLLEKEGIINNFDLYFYEEMLSNIKLNRNQNKKEIFIDIRDIMKDKKIKSYEKKTYLQKKNINSLYYYNIQRYEHNEDPSSFLIDKRRLTKEEYTYQYISTILPYICFTFMLFFPHFLICLYIPYIKKKNENQKKLCKILQFKQNIHSYKDIKPEHITNIIDNNVKTIVFFYNNDIFLNKYVKSLMVDLSKIFKRNSIPVNVVGVDTSKHNIPYNVMKDIHQNLFPLLYFILPYHYDNDSAVLKIEKPLTLENILSQIKDFVHIPGNTFLQIKDLSNRSSRLKKCIFEHEIMNKKKEDILYEYGSEIAHLSCMQLCNKVFF
ncbi:conserved Plasmodium protein, unknown function [Plasmodium ovale wallikeri]|uniref:Thioredoxin n=2 Tax=Plasmodium ovale TaxID=36330 RepID=A0A1A8ZZL2_PLAOA|nr:conserved Plasmodium protein, unknown function [Plasmodium ovale wallikeri]SBT49997.1 conserved Plasmodium protein, unknown function [Plasmodium ovale wallikeri]SBT82671.1 conserved Plasmodium protein, unknown function [Plasmodium ovale]